jgi:hypothetical protein
VPEFTEELMIQADGPVFTEELNYIRDKTIIVTFADLIEVLY